MASCKEEGCSVLTTGECVNALELDVCPHYSADEDELDEDDIDDEDIDSDDQADNNFDQDDKKGVELSKENLKDVHSGKALMLDEANKLAKSVLTRVIVLAGMPDAGKTTLLLTLMHQFSSKSSYEGYIFAGSNSLIDFEEKSHPSKIDSEMNTPETGRTPVGPHTFMHLKVAEKQNLENKTDLLFTDISGEAFRALKDSADECKKFELGARSDHFTLFFDTKDITSIKDRANSKASGLGMLRGLVESNALFPSCQVQIVFSKWDLFSKEKEDNHKAFIKVLKEEIQASYGKRFSISFYEISCRSDETEFPLGFGLDRLFLSWVKYSQLDQNKLVDEKIEERMELRQFMKFKHND